MNFHLIPYVIARFLEREFCLVVKTQTLKTDSLVQNPGPATYQRCILENTAKLFRDFVSFSYKMSTRTGKLCGTKEVARVKPLAQRHSGHSVSTCYCSALALSMRTRKLDFLTSLPTYVTSELWAAKVELNSIPRGLKLVCLLFLLCCLLRLSVCLV